MAHLLTGESLENAPDSLGWQQEERQQRQRKQRQSPLKNEHRDQGRDKDDEVRDDLAERAGQRPLGADHVVVHTANERAGLGAGEEADRHALHMVEELHSQIEDQAFADTSREPALEQRDDAACDRQRNHDQRERIHEPSVTVRDCVVDDATHE